MTNSAVLPKLQFLLPILALVLLAGCFSARGLSEIRSEPYPIIYEDDSTQRFGDADDNVFLEVRRAPISREIGSLAIHYPGFFPGGVKIKPGDLEEYVTVSGKNAYKVVLRTTHIRKRKRLKSESPPKELPEGWSLHYMADPATGASIPVLHGPVIPREQILYLVEGKSYIYYIFMRADGESIEPAKKRFENFVREDIDYG